MLDGRRVRPSPKIAVYVHHFWSVRWALRSPFTADTLPHPAAQILHFATAAGRRAKVLGVPTGRLSRTLTGEGEIFGITFRPAMFQPLLSAPMSSITDRVVPLGRIVGSKARAWTQAICEARGVDEKVAIAEAFLDAILPPLDSELARLRDTVERVAADRSILSVDDVSDAIGLDTRALQRRFRTYVGVTPKWVLQRYRLHEAAEQLAGPYPPSLATLAASLGYADQAHFGRDFKRAIGQTPRSFASSRRSIHRPIP